MATHRIDLGPMTGQAMATPCRYQGTEVLRSLAPIYDAARWLLDQGHADPSDTVETWRNGMRCMSGIVGQVAEWTVSETDREGLRMVRWVDVQAKRSRLAGLSRTDGRFPPSGAAVDSKTVPDGTEAPLGHETPFLVPSHVDLSTALPIAA